MDIDPACREIISLILSTPPGKLELRRIVRTVCKKYRLPVVPRNSDILSCATPEEYLLLRPVLLVKPSRTLSGVAPVAVMTSPAPCPHGICLPCPGGPDSLFQSPQSYTGGEPAARRAFAHDFQPYDQVSARLAQFEELGHHVDKAELIVMGGTITAREPSYQEWFVTECIRAMNEYPANSLPDTTKEEIFARNEISRVRCVAITFETRPDWCKKEHINRMLDLGVTKVELGVQHLDDEILEFNLRGCDVSDTVTANTLLRDAGLKVGFHMMPNLPGSTISSDRKMFHDLFADSRFRPDFLKIYPTLVTPGSKIEELYQKGEYAPYDEDSLVDLVADAKMEIAPYCRLQRIQRDIPADKIVAGSPHSNFRELAKDRLHKRGGRCSCIRCREIGRRRSDAEPVLRVLSYECCKGLEHFISFDSEDSLVGFARLRFPEESWRPETEGAAFVRELHVYGMVVPIGQEGTREDQQHRRYGARLLLEAETLAADEGYDKVAIMAGIGVRPYYQRLGYFRSGPYMIKDI
ncbi:MAG TPA: tRNA uridine(34) 5-carboxymethylaminomethyl modification radical SAM/GNAT enzyme Elp3 [Methanospirillum sp.]|jgi:elongator complex protein 3|uniref:elongator complex protein 3 n=1 Tax=Methanospirillum sp. TaxID=45200 RepID=UPI001BD4F519|nr:tRNA uridine(34) 5-carboxymethylaminomethyl modification radical SAM/GNAT enzyme Elp3 [Methanospirillum sp.]HPY59299.1 tRNA uridine(34) 5-carboxymethylaminomethyl modification radical SAM/GNAT enzyme Elp3 [Methanospirillum sp.]